MGNRYEWEAAVAVLKERGLTRYKCPVCGSRSFSMPGEYATLLTSDEFNITKMGAHIPAAILICKKCGHIDLFALAAIGLIPKEAE